MASDKTNAMRIADRAKVPYTAHTYDSGDGRIDGLAIAEKTGQDPARVFKTLVTKGVGGGYFVFMIPVACELDLKAAARAAGQKSVEMIAVKDINKVTGYIRGGCSPIGMKKDYPTVLDQSALAQEAILFSGGRIGTQMEMAPGDLIALCGIKTADIIAKEQKG